MALTAAPLATRIDRHAAVRLRLIDGFQLVVDDLAVDAPLAAQRLVAFLALHPRPLHRNYVAGALWLDKTDTRATSNLRSALWRTRGYGERLIRSSRTHLGLADDVYVDVAEVDAVARKLLAGHAGDVAADTKLLGGELLPDWYDDWVLIERERLRQLCLHGLEQLSASWLARGSVALAADAAFAAVAAEPLRESAHRALVDAHLAAGNCGEAARQFKQYRALLRNALGLEPSPAFRQQIAEVLGRQKVARG
ncbi:BTAD domain-containing putative transcriptional regulator [Actinoplanes sp. NPDC023714]|uniref:AfsR/SARP family transcriptional regulator n=1 Tax=Actinoplanes sp. NPDC023714 TaxID=3154322 RepID=UPI0033EE5BAC